MKLEKDYNYKERSIVNFMQSEFRYNENKPVYVHDYNSGLTFEISSIAHENGAVTLNIHSDYPIKGEAEK